MDDGSEIFDVVDSSDNVIGRDTRSNVHKKNLLHRSVHAIVLNSQGQVFVQHRAPHRDNNPDLWDSSVAGHLQAGEHYDQAMIRETEEEIGLVLSEPPSKLFTLEASATTDYEFCWIYEIVTDETLQINLDEAVGSRWISPKDLDSWIERSPQELTECFRHIWQIYRDARSAP